MDFKIASEKVWKINALVSDEDAIQKADTKKLEAFGMINKLTGFFSRPDPSDFELRYQELRYQPFWHIATRAHYVYDRNTMYQIDGVKSEVKTATIEGKDFQVTNGHIHLSALEHCKMDLVDEKFIEAMTGELKMSLNNYVTKAGAVEVKSDNITEDFGKDAIILPPQSRVSVVMREMFANMIKGIQADKIFEEEVEITAVDLYYRPIYAYKFFWKSKNAEGILELDGVTGDVCATNKVFSEYIGKVIDRDFLFDLGADAAGIFIPGGSLAVKMAKKAMDLKTK